MAGMMLRYVVVVAQVFARVSPGEVDFLLQIVGSISSNAIRQTKPLSGYPMERLSD
jgi:hypothetical protein